MASVRMFVKKHFNVRTAWLPILSGVRFKYYPSWHLTPIINREELDRLEAEGKLDDLKVIPVKPTPTSMTNSVFDDSEVNMFTNLLMKWSEKTQARQLMHDVFAKIKRIQLAKYHAVPEEEKSSIVTDPKKVFYTAVENCKPVLKVTPIKKGGITYQVPVPITAKMSRFLAMKWLIAAGRDKEGVISFVDQMTKEIMDAFYTEGRVVKRKHDLHKLCETNKAYAHYRWS